MQTALYIGASIGAVIGIFHACYVYRQEVRDSPNALREHPVMTRAGAAYYALWAFFLWVLLGSYVFYLWVVSCFVYVIVQGYKNIRYRLAESPRSSGTSGLS